VLASQVAAAVELARDCASSSHSAALWGRVRTPVYLVHLDDFDWLDRISASVDAVPDPATMARLREITSAIPYDAAAVASLNAARWIVRRYERHRH
jgi:hypothetical protein